MFDKEDKGDLFEKRRVFILPTASNHFEINAKDEEKVVENTRVENEIVANSSKCFMSMLWE